MRDPDEISRREYVTAAGAAALGAVSGCLSTDILSTEARTEVPDELVTSIEDEAVPVELADPADGLDAAAAQLADAPIVGIGESSHGVREFKAGSRRLVRRLVADHGYRLVAIEGTLGDFAPLNAYVTEEEGDLDEALSSVAFHFWQTEEIRGLVEGLREFNEGRPETDRAVVRGYDAQHYDVNAAAIRSYLDRVDPEYLSEIDDSLEPLTTPFHETSPSTFMTDSQVALIESLEERLRTAEDDYIEKSSESAFQLLRRHVWTLERGLQFQEKLAAEDYTAGKEIRDGAMADNVAWLREWTDADRAVVMGSVNHTMRNVGDSSKQGTRMGQHLAEEFGSDYYSLGLLFGSGSFAVPANHEKTEFETFETGGPIDETLEATLAKVSHPQFFLDLDAAREQSRIDSWIADASSMQVTMPNAPEKGARALPEAPGDLLDGVVFVNEVSPASFPYAESTGE